MVKDGELMKIVNREIYLVTVGNIIQQIIIEDNVVMKLSSLTAPYINLGQDADMALIDLKMAGIELKEIMCPRAITIDEVNEKRSENMQNRGQDNVWTLDFK